MKVLITGGHGGIGSAIRDEFLSKDNIVFSPSSQELDLKFSDSIEKYFSNNIEKYDIYIHCAGINEPQDFEDLTMDNFNNTLQINTFSSFSILKYVLPHMKNQTFGRIVQISSVWSLKAKSGRIAYAMSKSSLDALTRGIAVEYGKYNILINSILPGFIDTKLTRKNLSKEIVEEIKNNTPLRKIGKSEDIAKLAYFLGSKNNNFITGQSVIADGGYVL